MFGRYKEHDDEPDWREKLAEWRDAPPVVLTRPDWLRESPAALALIAFALVMLAASLIYFVMPADALPGAVPGRWEPPATTTVPGSTSTSTSTTTTTINYRQRNLVILKWSKLPPEEKERNFAFLRAMKERRLEAAELERLATEPPKPPARRWAYGYIAATSAILLFATAWYVSDLRSRRNWTA